MSTTEIVLYAVFFGGAALVIFLQYYFINRILHQKRLEQYVSMTPEQRQLEMSKLGSSLDKFKTSHLLHFVMTLFTAGIWGVIWFMVAQSNSGSRTKYEKMMNQITKSTGYNQKAS